MHTSPKVHRPDWKPVQLSAGLGGKLWVCNFPGCRKRKATGGL